MVDGCPEMIRPLKPCVIVDLDGTLLRGNSLRMLTSFLLRKLIREKRWRELGRMVMLIGLRRMKLISHVSMKYPIHRLSDALLSDNDMDLLVEAMLGKANRKLLERLAGYKRRGYTLWLASAAPDLYLPLLHADMDLDGCIGTPLTPSIESYVETRGERKRDLCQTKAMYAGLKIEAVVTDHSDDLPLLQLDGVERLLVNPSRELCRRLADKGLAFEVL